MKKFVLALAVLVLSFAACTTASHAQTPQPPAPVLSSINPLRLVMPLVYTPGPPSVVTDVRALTDFAYALEYRYGGELPLSNYISGTPKVEVTDSMLTIELDSPHATALRSFDSAYTVTPTYAKYYQIANFSPNIIDNGNHIGIGIVNANNFLKRVYLIYADVDVTVNGTYTYSGGSVTTYDNVALKAGWNFVIQEYNSSTRTTVYSSATQTMPSGFNARVLFSFIGG